MCLTRRELGKRTLLMAGGATLSLKIGLPLSASVITVDPQPLIALVRRLISALTFIGEPLWADEVRALQVAFLDPDAASCITKIQQVLDRHVLIEVQISPESRLSATAGSAIPVLYEQGWHSFLVKVSNKSSETSALTFRCPQAEPMGRRSEEAIVSVHDFTNGAVDEVMARDRWAEVSTWDKPPLLPTLSGLPVEYRIIQIYSRDFGKREASLEAYTGRGEQDLGFRSTVPIVFDCLPSQDVKLHIRDEAGRPTTASLLILDTQGRVYPTQSKRLFPDLWFERQVYRCNGETLRLPQGKYTIEYGRGPEYIRQQTSLVVGDQNPTSINIFLERWIQPGDFGYYSGDTHIHAAGCSHYESPSEGVIPDVMLRQLQGEALDVGDVLTWAPGYYYQSQFFSGHIYHSHDDQGTRVSESSRSPLMRYDVEVSGFPSSHCGHLVLLRLQNQHFPNTKTLDEWPSWNIPIVKWAKAQGAVVGYAHSAVGLAVDSTELPNYLMPRFDDCGANEYLVDITYPNLVDFISGCDLWPFVEMNIWYHTLSCGFRATFVGETDFPCITDRRVGGGRSYVYLPRSPLADDGYDAWIESMRNGHLYFGDGRSHIFDFSINSIMIHNANRQVEIDSPSRVVVAARVCARLEETISDETRTIQGSSPWDKPEWHLERARIGSTRIVHIELIVNGISVQNQPLEADGNVKSITFETEIAISSWVALRIYPSSHTNPMFVMVGGAPIRASRKSAEWCRQALDVCWRQKERRIRSGELDAARAAYEHARTAYDHVIAECS